MLPDSRIKGSGRIAIYVQHLLGTGHIHRASAIATAAARRGHKVMLITGGEPRPGGEPAGVQVIQLRPVRARAAGDWSLVTTDDNPVSDRDWQARGDDIAAAVSAFRPDLVVVEHFPFGRRAFSREILAMMDLAQRARPGVRAVASVRDIVQPPKSAVRAAEIAAVLNQGFDKVLVHGDPALISIDASFPNSGEIKPLIDYTGYIDAAASRDSTAQDCQRRGVLVSAGGGRAGADLLMAVARIRSASSLDAEPWTVITGRGASPEPMAALRGSLRPGDLLIDHADDFRARLRACRLSVSQAGYNTAVDLMATATPAVLVPFADGGEREQTIRAEAMAAASSAFTVCVDTDDLAGAIGRRKSNAGDVGSVDLDGLRKSVDALETLCRSETLVDA